MKSQGKLQIVEWFVGRKLDTQFKRLFGRMYRKITKSRPLIQIGYRVRLQEVLFTQVRRKRVWLKYQKHTRFLHSQSVLSQVAVRTVNLTSFLQTTSHSVLSYSCRFLAAELIGQTHIRMQFSRKDYYHLQDTQ